MPNFFDRKNTQKVILVQKNLPGKTKKYQESCQEIQENPRILPRNPGKPKNKFAAISNRNPYIEFGGSQLAEPF